MEFDAYFETNSVDLTDIWNSCTQCFSHKNPELPMLFSKHTSFFVYFRCYLLLTGDVEGASVLIKNAITFLKEHQNESETITKAIFLMPSTLNWFYRYTSNTTDIIEHIDEIEALIAGITIDESNPVLYAYAIGSINVVEHLQGLANLDPERIDLSKKIAFYNSVFYKEKLGIYQSDDPSQELLLNLLPCFFSYEQDNAMSSLRLYLMNHSFEVLKEDKIILFDAMMNVENEKALYSTVLESGLPKLDSPYAYMAPLCAMIEYLMGIDIPSLGKGKSISKSLLPLTITYNLTIPDPNGFVSFKLENDHFTQLKF